MNYARRDFYTEIIIILYGLFFICTEFLIYPLSLQICKTINIPYDFSISIMSFGFANELTLIISIIILIIFHLIVTLYQKIIHFFI